MSLTKLLFSLNRSVVIAFSSIVLIICALLFNSAAIANRPVVEPEPLQVITPRVSVLDVTPSYHAIVLKGNGQATPKYQLALTSQVSGQVMKLADNFQSGQRFEQGQTLAWIDPTSYQQNLAGAKHAVEQAQVAILEEERQLRIVERDRGRASHNKLGSALVYRTPQLKMAKAGLVSAEQQVKMALRDLANTQLSVPFDALVVTRDIAPGQFVQQGQQVATLYDSKTIEFKVFLPLSQWHLLSQQLTTDSPVSVSIVSLNGDRWQGHLDRVEQHIDMANQQRAVVVTVDNPLNQVPQLLAGTFASIELSLAAQQPLLAVPAKSLSADGQLWYVNEQQQLMALNAEVVFQKDGLVYIKPPQSSAKGALESYRVVATPLPSYVVKQAVEAVSVQS